MVVMVAVSVVVVVVVVVIVGLVVVVGMVVQKNTAQLKKVHGTYSRRPHCSPQMLNVSCRAPSHAHSPFDFLSVYNRAIGGSQPDQADLRILIDIIK